MKIYGSRDQLIRFIIRLVKALGEDAGKRVLERLSLTTSDKHMDVVFPYTPHIVKVNLDE